MPFAAACLLSAESYGSITDFVSNGDSPPRMDISFPYEGRGSNVVGRNGGRAFDDMAACGGVGTNDDVDEVDDGDVELGLPALCPSLLGGDTEMLVRGECRLPLGLCMGDNESC